MGEEENYRSKDLGIKQISLEQYRRCLILGSRNILNDPQQREEYVNAVRLMEITVIPELLNPLHAKLKEKFVVNENKITSLELEYKNKLQELKTIAGDKQINQDKLKNFYERRLIDLFHEKLINIGLLLKKKNYYEEEIYIDGLND